MNVKTCPNCQKSFDIDDVSHKKDGSCPYCGIIIDKYSKLKIKQINEQELKKAEEKNKEEENYYQSNKSGSSDYLPFDIKKYLKWGFTAIGFFLFIHTGISIFTKPDHEILFSLRNSETVCMDNPDARHYPELQEFFMEFPITEHPKDFPLCIQAFKMDIMNSGFKPIPQTVIRVNNPEKFFITPEDLNIKTTGKFKPQFDKTLSLPVIKDYDKAIRRDVKIRNDGEIINYALGKLGPTEHVTLYFRLPVHKNKQISWDKIFRKIDVSNGNAKKGEMLKFTVISRYILTAINLSAKSVAEDVLDTFLDGVINKEKKETDVAADFKNKSSDLMVTISGNGSNDIFQTTVIIKNSGSFEANDPLIEVEIPNNIIIRQFSYSMDYYQPSMGELLKESNEPRSKAGSLPDNCKETRAVSGNKKIECVFKKMPPKSEGFLFLTMHAQNIQKYGELNIKARVSSSTPETNESNNNFELDLLGIQK